MGVWVTCPIFQTRHTHSALFNSANALNCGNGWHQGAFPYCLGHGVVLVDAGVGQYQISLSSSFVEHTFSPTS